MQTHMDVFACTFLTDAVAHVDMGLETFLLFKAWYKSMFTSDTPAVLVHAATAATILEAVGRELDTSQRQFILRFFTLSLALAITDRSWMNHRTIALHYWMAIVLRQKTFFATDRSWMGIALSSALPEDEVVLRDVETQ
jgi:hypothetical protein